MHSVYWFSGLYANNNYSDQKTTEQISRYPLPVTAIPLLSSVAGEKAGVGGGGGGLRVPWSRVVSLERSMASLSMNKQRQ